MAYGAFGSILYNPNDPEHLERRDDTYMALCGERRINDTFHIVLPRVTRLLNYSQPS